LKKVVVITTGGTIAMKRSPMVGGAVPMLKGDDFMALLPRGGVDLAFEEFTNLPSSHLTPTQVLELGQRVEWHHLAGEPFGSLASWPHVRPAGICVGYTDGHAQYWAMEEDDYQTLRRINAQWQVDLYVSLMFEAFDTGNMGAQALYRHKFRTAGTYGYICVYHQGMRGTVVVQ
jgi:hypothetical protein